MTSTSSLTRLAEAYIRRAEPADGPALAALWERSVRATHAFVNEADLAVYRPIVAKLVDDRSLELWVLIDASERPMGFLGLSPRGIDALFLEPAHLRQGWGRRLVEYAQTLRGGALDVDVNEENVQARAFYEALGFVVVGRTAIDEMGRPHPVLHLHREAPVMRASAGRS